MKAVQALLQSAQSLGIILWVDGDQLRYKARQPVSDGMKGRIREYKADIINLLNSKPVRPVESVRPTLPGWCNPQCECFCRLELPSLENVLGCEINTTSGWRWVRLSNLTGCPLAVKEVRK